MKYSDFELCIKNWICFSSYLLDALYLSSISSKEKLIWLHNLLWLKLFWASVCCQKMALSSTLYTVYLLHVFHRLNISKKIYTSNRSKETVHRESYICLWIWDIYIPSFEMNMSPCRVYNQIYSQTHQTLLDSLFLIKLMRVLVEKWSTNPTFSALQFPGIISFPFWL